MRQLLILALAMAAMAQTTSRDVVIVPTISAARGLADWELDGSGTWKVPGPFLQLEVAGTPAGPIRRPAAIAILRGDPVSDFIFKVEVRSTAPVDLAVRDVLVIFGYQSPTQFYYVHLAAKTDAVHNGIFLVNNADRKRLDEPTSTGRLIDQAWHRVRVERLISTGTIRVFFDDDKTPVLSASDKTLPFGRVGVGSFDETGEFRAVEVRGTRK